MPLLGLTFLVLGLTGVLALGNWKVVLLAVGVLATSWTLLVGVEGIRIGGWSRNGYRVAVALAVIHSGLLVGFWRGLAEMRKFRPPRSTEPLRLQRPQTSV